MVRQLPAGTVTFLFTDVEGSTRLLHELGAEGYAEVLAEHRRVVRETVARHDGVEVDTQGDSFFVAFPTAPGALQATGEIKAALVGGPIRLRMGLHTGTPRLAEEGYVGVDVHRAARIAACGHGGQVLVSAATAELVRSSNGSSLVDLGDHRLKDLSAPERIYQLGDERFPPLKTLGRTNLPVPATSFVGRVQELGDVQLLLARDDVRLLTLTGAGGTGKTRLALQAAAEASGRFTDGVFWIPLAPLRDPELVLDAAVQALGAKDGLREHVADKRLLLLFDSFEHVAEAASGLSELLAACPNLELLVTSREPLRIAGEQEYAVPPLARAEALALFLARATAVKPGFEPHEAVAEICRRLDDLPLALELAAARVKALSPEQILERLERRLPLLTGGARDAPERQRTLRATIEWSHDLLSPEEQAVFRRFGVFRGGCTLEAAEELCEADLDTLQSLVDKSLLRHTGERFWMLETIREFASERLVESEEHDAVAERHFDHFLGLAERAYADRFADVTAWFPILDAEHDNLRAALEWALGRDPGAQLRLAAGVAPFWLARARLAEARAQLVGGLARHQARDPVRARALTHLGEIESAPNDLPHLEAARTLWRELGHPREEALALAAIGGARDGAGDYEAARRAHEQSLALLRRAGAPEPEMWRPMAGLCHVLVATGDVEQAETMARSLIELGASYGAPRLQQAAMHFFADCALVGGDYAESERRYLRALAYARASGLVIRSLLELLGVGMSASGQGDYPRAVRLASAARAQAEALEFPWPIDDRWWRGMEERLIGRARADLAPDELERAEQAGREAEFEAVLDEVLGTLPS